MKHTFNRQQRVIIRFLIVFVVLFFIFCLFLFRTPLVTFFWRIGTPIFSTQKIFSTLDQQFSSKAYLITQNELLREELSSSTAALADRDVLFQENIALKNSLGRTIGGHPLLGLIIMRPPATPYDTLTIDVGSKEGVSRGDLVYASGTNTIGIISEVYYSNSRVTLFSSSGETYNAILRTQDNKVLPITVTGQGGGSLIAKIPMGSQVVPGDAVTLSNIEGSFVGTISSVKIPQDQSFETIFIQEPINPFTLWSVEVLKSYVQ